MSRYTQLHLANDYMRKARSEFLDSLEKGVRENSVDEGLFQEPFRVKVVEFLQDVIDKGNQDDAMRARAILPVFEKEVKS